MKKLTRRVVKKRFPSIRSRGIYRFHYRKVYIGKDHSLVVMKRNDYEKIERRLEQIQAELKIIREDVSEIHDSMQDELRAFREREYWKGFGF